MLIVSCQLNTKNKVGSSSDDVNFKNKARTVKQSFVSEKVIDKHEEARALNTAKKIEAILKRNGSIYNNKKVTAYLQKVMNRLYPAFKNKITVKILNFTDLNAFALANGTIYFNLGLIARLENEAQLATVLGHEGAHYVYKHSIRKRQKIKSVADVRTNKRGIYGYSRNLEREADRHAFRRLKKAGYNTSEAYKVFVHLAAEVKLLQRHTPGLVRLHPKLTERITSFRVLHNKSGNKAGVKHKKIYNLQMRKVKIADLEANLATGNYKSIILILGRLNMNKTYPGYYPYFLGEAYRLRGQQSDYDTAAKSYLKSTQNSPQYAPAYNALGIYYLKKNSLHKARQYFKQYLKLSPQGKYAAYANHYIMSINKKLLTGH